MGNTSLGGKTTKKLSLGHIRLEILIRYIRGDVKLVVKYVSLQERKTGWRYKVGGISTHLEFKALETGQGHLGKECREGRVKPKSREAPVFRDQPAKETWEWPVKLGKH